jgi:DNA-directed RNA polymerase specialized sigma24 family protein
MKAARDNAPGRIPRFRTYEEEAEFWDTHSPEDFPGEFENAPEIRFATPLEIVRESDRGALIKALAGLEEGERQVLALSLLGLRGAEIAQILGWSRAECQRALREARRKTKSLTPASE